MSTPILTTVIPARLHTPKPSERTALTKKPSTGAGASSTPAKAAMSTPPAANKPGSNAAKKASSKKTKSSSSSRPSPSSSSVAADEDIITVTAAQYQAAKRMPSEADKLRSKQLLAEAMALQPTINIGLIGHVAHGKSTLTKALSDTKTGRHHKEQVKGMTIKLGYANARIFQCDDPRCPPPWCYRSAGPESKEAMLCVRPRCGKPMHVVQHVSFVDSPGHHDLISTMLSGAAVMDAAILVVAGNEPCPRPQTQEHVLAAQLVGLDLARNVVVAQSKVDLLSPLEAQVSQLEIERFLTEIQQIDSGPALMPSMPRSREARSSPVADCAESKDASDSGAASEQVEGQLDDDTDDDDDEEDDDSEDEDEDSDFGPPLPPIVPIIADQKLNTDVICEYIVKRLATAAPQRDLLAPARMLVIRSFDVNKPGAAGPELVGGVVGGSLLQGVLRIGQLVELRPGIRHVNGSTVPIISRVVSLKSETQALQHAVPGGLIAVGLDLDPALTKGDRLVGQVLGAVGELPPVFKEAVLTYKLVPQELCTVHHESSDDASQQPQQAKADSAAPRGRESLRKGQSVLFCVGGARVEGSILAVGFVAQADGTAAEPAASVKFNSPICAEPGASVAVFGRLGGEEATGWRLLASGHLDSVQSMKLAEPVMDAVEEDENEAEVENDTEEKSEVPTSSLPASDDCAPPAAVSPQPESSSSVAPSAAISEEEKEARLKEHQRRLEERQESHMYPEPFPETGQVVMVRVDRIETVNRLVYVKLLEYGEMEGLVMSNELSQRRIRGSSLKQFVNLSRNEVMVVLRVDPTKGMIDLSKKRVSPKEKATHEAWYSRSRLVQSIMARVAQLCNMPLELINQKIAWPLYHKVAEMEVEDLHPLDLLRKATEDKAVALSEELQLGPQMSEALAETLLHRLVLKPLKVRADIELSCLAPMGVHAIKKTLAEVLKSHTRRGEELEEGEEAIEVRMVASPLYAVTMSSRDRAQAFQEVDDVCEALLQHIRQLRGAGVVVVPPRVITTL